MFRKVLVTALTLATVAASPLPFAAGPAQAQQICTFACFAKVPDGGGSASTAKCTEPMGHLRRVYEEELDNLERVSVIEICRGNSYGVMRNSGNAGSLRQAVAQNETAAEALWLKNFTPDDLVGVRMTGEGSAILYVHPFHR